MSATDTRAVVQQMVARLEDAIAAFPHTSTRVGLSAALEAGRALLAALPEQPAAPQGDSVAGSGLPLDTVRTGWPEGMLQDDDRNLSRWLANTPDARRHAREAAQLGAVSVPAETASGARPQDEHAHPVIGVVLPSQSVRIGGEGERNQCDGCARGLPVNGFGNHRGPGDGDVQACTANRYGGSAEQPAPTFDAWWQSEVTANGGVPIGADYRHWAEKGYRAASQPSEEGRKA